MKLTSNGGFIQHILLYKLATKFAWKKMILLTNENNKLKALLKWFSNAASE